MHLTVFVASEISEHIETGKWTAARVLQIYTKKAAEVQAKISGLVFEEKSAQATRLEEEFARMVIPVGLLHGARVKFSVRYAPFLVDFTLNHTKEANGYDTTKDFP
jgi:hypothetical protein